MNLKKLSNRLRFSIISISNKTKSPHLASSLSCIDIVATIYEKILKINNKKNNNNFRDRFILSKDIHQLYTLLWSIKIIKNELNSYKKFGSLLRNTQVQN